MELEENEYEEALQRLLKKGMINWDGTKEGNVSLTEYGIKMANYSKTMTITEVANAIVETLYKHDKIELEDICDFLTEDHDIHIPPYDPRFISALKLLKDNHILETGE